MMDKDELFDEVVGGSDLRTELVRSDLSEPSELLEGMEIITQTDRQLVRLLTLHPALKRIRFRNNSLKGLDEQDKKLLLRDMQDALGIARLSDE